MLSLSIAVLKIGGTSFQASPPKPHVFVRAQQMSRWSVKRSPGFLLRLLYPFYRIKRKGLSSWSWVGPHKSNRQVRAVQKKRP